MAKTIKLETTKPVVPMIYAYTTPEIKRHDGWTKIGYTERDVDERIKQQTHTADVAFHEEWRDKAIYKDTEETFRDSDFHAYLRKEGVEQEEGKNNEWFHITGPDSKQKFDNFSSNCGVLSTPEPRPYVLRKEQEEAVERTQAYFESTSNGEFLWNAKPRFGKTLAVYDLCLRMKAKFVLIVTNRPAVANSWYEDYVKFIGDASGYRFVSDTDALKNKPYVVSRETLNKANVKTTGFFEFLSLQDLKGSVHFGGQYNKLKRIDDLKWDILVIDEAHEGVDTPKTDVAFDRIKRKYTLHLSGTPFKALACNKFTPDAIYSWTYADEQRAKRDWTSTDGVENPYADLPQLHMYTYQPSEMIQDIVKQGIEIDGETEEYAFDLNEFFAVNEKGLFVHNDAVNRFLDSLTTQEKYPFSTKELRDELKHTFWLLKYVASAKALAKKLKTHPVFKNYEIVLAAGDGKLNDNLEMAAGDGKLYDDSENLKAYNKVKAAISQHDKTITLSVGQLTTGITINEWSAVLMLSNASTSEFYMQAAFRAQNPCLFHEGTTFKRKQNAYVFDFDPARTLVMYEQIANDLNADTACGRGDGNARKANLFELLNFLPIIGEDNQGEMIELDAERILSVTSKTKAKEVVRRGFKSNTLFQNIGAIFAAPCAVSNIIRKIPIFKDEKQSDESFEGITSKTIDDLSVDPDGEINVSKETVIGTVPGLFGPKIYKPIDKILIPILKFIDTDTTAEEADNCLGKIEKTVRKEIIDVAISRGKEKYGADFTKSAKNAVSSQITNSMKEKLRYTFENFKIDQRSNETEHNNSLISAKTEEERRILQEKFDQKAQENVETFREKIRDVVEELKTECEETIITRVETDIRQTKKNTIEESVRDHLRGFSRTIPSFLMAYGSDHEITLANFDQIVPAEVFLEVTGITLENFRFLRDGGTYRNEETGEEEFFKGKLFDEIVFNDSINVFLALKKKLANYFNEEQTEDIFDYIPNLRNNQIFTPKKVVVQMVDLLEKENPGCFDDPNKTFADLYMKSGLYITEIVKRLYRSEKLKALYPDSSERLNHIFAHQVYGLAPTEIIYRITLALILGFKDDVAIEKHNIKLCDALQYAKKGTLEEELRKLFPERNI